MPPEWGGFGLGVPRYAEITDDHRKLINLREYGDVKQSIMA